MTVAPLASVCRSHQPHTSALMARRAAEAHPLYARINCPKCDEGKVFEPFRCTDDPTHWHVGHAWPRKDATVIAAAVPPPLTAGDRWAKVSGLGMGVPVEIVRVTVNSVYHRALSRGEDASQIHKTPLDNFRALYAPLKLASDRQKRLADAARSGTPVALPALIAEPVDAAPDPIDEAIDAIRADAPASSPPAEQPIKSVTPPKLSGQQAREIYGLVLAGERMSDIARTFEVSDGLVHRIAYRLTYAWATEGLPEIHRRARKASAAASPEPPTAPKEAAPVQILTHPTELDANVKPTPPAPITLVSDLADALELLLTYQGRALPRFVSEDGIRALVDQARRRSA